MKLYVNIFLAFFLLGLISCASTTDTKPSTYGTYKIGDKSPSGGYIFYDKGNDFDGWRYLEAAPVDVSGEYEGSANWGCPNKSVGAKSPRIGSGKINTQAIVKSCKEAQIAAKLCVMYRGGGKNDWFLPSLSELNYMFEYLHKKRIGGFAAYYYWSSTEDDNETNIAFDKNFSNGEIGTRSKVNYANVRPIRAF